MHVSSSVFEELWSCLQQRPDLARFYMRYINKLPIEELVPFDMWFLLLFLKEDLQVIQVERFVSRKLARLPVHSPLFNQAIEGQQIALLPVFKPLLRYFFIFVISRMGELLARNTSVDCQELAESLFLACWNEFQSPFHQQEVHLFSFTDY